MTGRGLSVAYGLANFFKDELKEDGIKIFTSTMRRAITTSEVISKCLDTQYMSLKTLDELDYGLCDGLTLVEVGTGYAE